VIVAQLAHAVLGEMAMTAKDLINRRTELGSTARATARASAAAAGALAPTAPVTG
jgi:glycerol-3-phosphate dehydrogenase